VIEKNIPIPGPARGKRTKYPFADMEPGDSVLIEGEDTKGPAYQSAKAIEYNSRGAIRFTARTVDNGVRIWRVE